MASCISSRVSSAACLPSSAFMPAPKPPRQRFPDVYLLARFVLVEVLRVGVDRDEIDALHVRGDHVIDRIAAGAADADDAYPRV